jgi:tRNA threonylcarbamoyl adenosine modification protein (Sua5/YciO/YrdC/YwlC family)
MAFFFAVHKDNPESRLLRRAVKILKQGGVIVYPTDSGYALACCIGKERALARIKALRHSGKNHLLSIACHDLLQMATYANMSPANMCILKAFTPGCYTFVLNPKPNVSVMILHPERSTLGLRVPKHKVAQALLECLQEPLLSTTLSLPGMDVAVGVPATIREALGAQVDLILDAGICDIEPTTVVDLTGEMPVILRRGRGDPTPFE